ncbi:MAG: efflux RND transporter periplasmic adaptor subunit, partial [Planctomycetota bacterium]
AEASERERRAAVEKATRDLESARAAKEEAEARLVDAEREFKRLDVLVRDRIVTVSERDKAETAFHVSRAQVSRAEAFVRSAEAEEKRARSDADTFVARVESARKAAATSAARLKEAEEYRDIAFIRAPFAGKVLRKEAEVGEVIAPATTGGQSTRGALLTLADFKTLEMEVDVFERDVSLVEDDAPARIVLDAYPKVIFSGRVRQVVPTADRQKATVQVKVSFDSPDGRVLPEMGGKVVFLAAGTEATDEPDRVWAPSAAVAERGGSTGVFLLIEESTELRVRFAAVNTGETRGTNVEINDGLKGGERVVLSPGAALKDGDLVSVDPGTP